MKRHRRVRRPGRQGIGHISDFLDVLIQEIEQDERPEPGIAQAGEPEPVAVLTPLNNQATFAFYQTTAG